MGLSHRLSKLKSEWNFFWHSFFGLFSWFTQKIKNKTGMPVLARAKTSESMPWLSLQRQRLHQRLEEIEKEAAKLKISNQDPKQLVMLHDEGQDISEKISLISQKINNARNSKEDIAL